MLTNGTFLGNRYEIIEKIGTGGMSDVYRAKDHSLSRDIAIKVLKQEFASDSAFVSKFRAEAQAAAALEHPNIVNIYDVGSEDGLYYIVMEYVEGITLKSYIGKKGSLGYNEVLSIAIQVGRGIEAAHNKGIVHQDIKPQNIIISKEGKVKVTDFGIARAVSSNTIHADMMGSVHYASPEQARNGYVSYSSDIYSLGIVMYEMCTGRVPFDGDTTVAIAIQHIQSEMVPPQQYVPDLPVAVCQIIKKATMKSPDRRYSSMSELLTDLKKALVNPNENFVVIPENTDNDLEKTRVVSPYESEEIRRQTAQKPVTRKEKEPEEYDDEDDEDEGDGPVNPRMDKAITIMGIAAGFVIVAIVIFFVGSVFDIFHFGGKSQAEEKQEKEEQVVEVPNLLGMTESEAQEALEKAGLTYKKLGESSSDKYEKGQIMFQDQRAGTKLTKNTSVGVTVSTGEGSIDVPSVVGEDLETATKTLEDAGFEVSTNFEYSQDVAQNKVIAQTPAGNAQGKKGDTVTLTVSRGTESIKVPSVVGKSESAAKSTLENAGLKVGDVSEVNSDTVPKGQVVSTDPAAGRSVDRGTTVNLVISSGSQTYSFDDYIEVQGDYDSNYVVLEDANGKVIKRWTISEGSDVSASGITTKVGTIRYYTDRSMDEEITSEAVSFDAE
ncbi:MAG: Stk1 family PASTA domain-containing Ser/Thr kinase [Lachnospiraceae bacterium]|nr:Stk1 family PASTA domain-containing Ser/Thr kinase [Lachnospiraceae bacterium]MBQ2576551.1 Stk1 family PASTA domain-containing Ser/Thr kinase [Lachnospiraceae bacterium]MEE3354907.1 Stk1 family PASTA domain-containing Ser/Thr kinase [Candidatus Weimeria sp.]